MSVFNKYVIEIIKSALTECEPKAPSEELNWEELFALAKAHKITCLVGLGLKSAIDKAPDAIKSKFQDEIKKSIFLDLNQEFEAVKICEAFEKSGLKYMIMKGYNIKKMYPQTCMRYMCDIDILIENDSYEKYDETMRELGYDKKMESDHEHIFQKKPLINVELHKSIVPSYNTDLYDYYGDGWKYAEKCNENGRYEYSQENQYVFLIVHLAKHYKSSGIGLSHFIDIYIMNQKCEFDMEYVRAELQKLGLEKFYDNVLRLIDFWFGEGEESRMLLDMSEHIFSSGAYGNSMNRIATETLKGIEKYGDEKTVKKAKVMEIIFPTCKRLAENFPILNKCPWLYPVCLVFRNI